jgi:hypothetical protein
MMLDLAGSPPGPPVGAPPWLRLRQSAAPYHALKSEATPKQPMC